MATIDYRKMLAGMPMSSVWGKSAGYHPVRQQPPDVTEIVAANKKKIEELQRMIVDLQKEVRELRQRFMPTYIKERTKTLLENAMERDNEKD